jgi:hypothetical protein
MLRALFGGDLGRVPRGRFPRPPERACSNEQAADIQRRVSEAPEVPTVPGEQRHALERDKRRRLREELAAMLAEPLIDARLLTADERQQIRLAETLRRRPVGRPK